MLFNNNDSTKQNWLYFLFYGFCIFEAILGIGQFIFQKSFGLKYLGEQILSPQTSGIATIVSGGTKFFRAYGTFPHPNLLSAFLVVGILINIFLLQQNNKRYIKYLLFFGLFISIFGFITTFSRSAFLALFLSVSLMYGIILFKTNWRNLPNFKPALLIIILSCVAGFIIFKPFLLTRVDLYDKAILARKTYNGIALNIAKNKPIFGIGMGENVLHMEQYYGRQMQPWEKQPIHNYFLLSAAELGIPGALILLWIFLSHLKSLILNLKSKFDSYLLFLISILLSFLVLMQFDHYFYTLQQTQLLLWLILGLIAAETHQRSTEIANFDKQIKIPEKGTVKI